MTQADANVGPLRGIRVVDLTSVVFGPYCTQVLGDLGADVVKVEGPDGDSTRSVGPGREPGMAGLFMNLNRNKRGLCLDLKQAPARTALLKLAEHCDVFMHSMRPQAIARLGLTYETLAAANPRIVYCNAWGFGSRGPYAEKAAYDDIIQAASGMVDLIATASGEPSYVPTVIADKVSGLTLVYAALAALLERGITGRGQEIEVPMFETTASFVLAEHMTGAMFDPPLSAPVYARQVVRNRKPFATADGSISMIVYTDKQWRAFGGLVGVPDILSRPKFATLAARTANIGEVYALVAAKLRERTTDAWLAALDAAGIPAVKVLSTTDLFTDEHLVAVDFFERVDDPEFGSLRYPGSPALFGGKAPRVRRRAPRLGEHNAEILGEAGLTAAEIATLAAA